VKSLRSAPKTLSRLVFILSVFLFSLLQPAYISAQEKPSAAHKLEPVTLGLSAKHVLNLPIYLAQRYGIFESEGFDLKPITTKTSTAIAALVSGDLDYITAFNSGLGAAVGGAPLVATYVSTDKPLLYLISRPDIKDAKGLRGGLIGHGGSRGSHYHATVAMVKYLGLDAEKDVKLISTIDVTQGLTALFSGAVAARTLSPPYDAMAVRRLQPLGFGTGDTAALRGKRSCGAPSEAARQSQPGSPYAARSRARASNTRPIIRT
jgi:ABC-type nitrate/sulfonate/bicarbonate transport system substrate-binding protein